MCGSVSQSKRDLVRPEKLGVTMGNDFSSHSKELQPPRHFLESIIRLAAIAPE